MTITESIRPISTDMYARRGLIPTTPVLTLSGVPRCGLPDGLEAVPPDPEALAALDRAAYGFERAADHQFWGEQATQASLWLLDGEPIAYAYADSHGLIGPIAGRDGAAAALALRAKLGHRESRPAEVLLLGSAPGLVETAFASGLRLTRPPGLLLLSGTGPPEVLVISGYWLL